MDPVTISRMALGWIGANKISSFDDDSHEAELCSANFTPAVRSVLADRAWLFATGFKSLTNPQDSGDAELPLKWGPVPSEVISVRGADDGSGDYSVTFEKAGRFVLTESISSLTLQLKVTEYVNDVDSWDPNFCRCVAALMASDLAVPLTEGGAMQDRMEKKYLRELEKAGRLDAMQSSPGRLMVKKASLSRVR
jgi:hypothetical protein